MMDGLQYRYYDTVSADIKRSEVDDGGIMMASVVMIHDLPARRRSSPAFYGR
jgi:hypothetical protein